MARQDQCIAFISSSLRLEHFLFYFLCKFVLKTSFRGPFARELYSQELWKEGVVHTCVNNLSISITPCPTPAHVTDSRQPLAFFSLLSLRSRISCTLLENLLSIRIKWKYSSLHWNYRDLIYYDLKNIYSTFWSRWALRSAFITTKTWRIK